MTKRSEENFKKASHLAQQIKNLIRAELKLSCSIGISPNKLISKIASDYQKPDGLTIVEPDRIEQFLEQLNIRVIPGIGKKTAERLVLELKDRVKDIEVTQASKNLITNIDDIENALISLGYSASQASIAIKALPDNISVNDGIRQALKSFSNNT